MQHISSSTIEEVSQRTDIVSLVGEYVRLEKRGSNYWGCCPFHAEKTPSFSVTPEKKMCYCFGCHKGGSAINFIMEVEKISFVEAVKFLAKKNGVEIIYDGKAPTTKEMAEQEARNRLKDDLLDLYKRIAATYRYFLTSTEQGRFAREYLASRGVSEEIAEEFGLGYAPADRRWLKSFLSSKNYSQEFLASSGLFSQKYPDIAFFSERLMFPICNSRGQVIAFGGRILRDNGPKYLNSGEMPQYKKGETLYAFHLAKNEIRQQKSVILCEGYMDVIAYHQAGIKYAVAPLGTALTEDQIRILRPFADTFYLSFDGDSAGQAATYRAIMLCRKAGVSVKIVQINESFRNLPPDAAKPKDPADVLLNFGAETLTKIVNQSRLDADYLLFMLAEKYPVNTPEGKSKAALDFFPYIDALQSEIQKESCFELLCRTFSLDQKAVRSDFNRRNAVNQRNTAETQTEDSSKTNPINYKKNAELRAMLAVAANVQYFVKIRSIIQPDDFEDAGAREIFFILEECFREEAASYDVILAKCSSDKLRKLISEAVSSNEFAEDAERIIGDGIARIKRNSLERRRDHLANKIRQCNGTTLEDLQLLKSMQYEKMTIDNELKAQKDIPNE